MHSAPITSIRQLVEELLRHRDAEAYAGILARYDVPGHDLEPYFRWNSRHYTRTCINRNEEFELLVICYEPGQRTSIHDYDSQMAWIHPVMGEVVEERFTFTQGSGVAVEREIHLRPGTVHPFTSGPSIHRFTNRGPGRAVTLNLYARPVRKWRVYDEGTGTSIIAPPGPPR
ncbi:MAG TPA: cysteine dioxygenase family protein [Flavobacteriales bacterium]|nr:cysteine dioxygenase family protein [Flavobacteriales bacterium]